MSSSKTGDGVRPTPAVVEPDAHGQAALLLAESTLHMLVERSVLTVAQAVVVVETAADVKVEVATAAGESEGRMMASLDLLDRISTSIAADGKGIQWSRPLRRDG